MNVWRSHGGQQIDYGVLSEDEEHQLIGHERGVLTRAIVDVCRVDLPQLDWDNVSLVSRRTLSEGRQTRGRARSWTYYLLMQHRRDASDH